MKHFYNIPGVLISGAAALALSGFALAAEEEKPMPAPRDAAGHVIISGDLEDFVGIWVPDYRSDERPTFNFDTVKMKPWAKGLYDARQLHDLEPHARCKASGGVRQFLTPYGVEIVNLPALRRLYIFDIGGPHTFREVYMDGRSHPANYEHNNYGHSVGWWEGDTLVVDSVGYNTQFWFERRGLPFTEHAHVIEHFTRRDADNLDYRFMLEDPYTYETPVIGSVHLTWHGDEELFEYQCLQYNFAPDLMVNEKGRAVGRTSPIVP